jgi:hypothetical protein
MAWNGDLGSGASRSRVGNSYLSVTGTTGLGVGFCGGVDPRRFNHDLTSETFETRASCLGYCEDELQRVPEDFIVVDVGIGAQDEAKTAGRVLEGVPYEADAGIGGASVPRGVRDWYGWWYWYT